MSIPAPDEISIEDPLCDSSLGSMVTLDYVTPLTHSTCLTSSISRKHVVQRISLLMRTTPHAASINFNFRSANSDSVLATAVM